MSKTMDYSANDILEFNLSIIQPNNGHDLNKFSLTAQKFILQKAERVGIETAIEMYNNRRENNRHAARKTRQKRREFLQKQSREIKRLKNLCLERIDNNHITTEEMIFLEFLSSELTKLV